MNTTVEFARYPFGPGADADDRPARLPVGTAHVVRAFAAPPPCTAFGVGVGVVNVAATPRDDCRSAAGA